jgi:preprotein translocase subunit SecD
MAEAAPASQLLATPAASDCFWPAELPAYLYSLEADSRDGRVLDGDDMATASAVIRRRVGLFDNQEYGRMAVPAAQVELSETAPVILVALKRIDEADQATIERLLQATGHFEIIDSQEEALPTGTVVSTTLDAATPVAPGSGTLAARVFESIISSADVVPTTVAFDEPVIRFQLSPEGAARLGRLYESQQGQPVAFLLDNVVIWSPRVGGTESSVVVINRLQPSEARALAIMLRSGPLPMRLVITGREELGPAELC